MAFRRIMMGVVTPDTRFLLWRQHLESFLMPGSALSSKQQEMVATTIPLLPRLFAAPAPNPTMTEWERQAATVFSREEARRIFMEIGPPEPPEGIPLPADANPTATV